MPAFKVIIVGDLQSRSTQLKSQTVCACCVLLLYWQVVYNRNGVKVTATPVSHYNTSGPVAYRLDWQGLSFTYSGKQDCGLVGVLVSSCRTQVMTCHRRVGLRCM
jgi:hypothetical protein